MVKAGQTLAVDTQYFLESYEYCIQLAECLEAHLHAQWHSSGYEDR